MTVDNPQQQSTQQPPGPTPPAGTNIHVPQNQNPPYSPQQTDPPPQSQPPQQPSPVPMPQAQSTDPQVTGALNQIGQTLQALPEQIVNSFREANPQQPAQPQQPQDSGQQASQQSGTQPTGQPAQEPQQQVQQQPQLSRRERFQRSWFGMSDDA